MAKSGSVLTVAQLIDSFDAFLTAKVRAGILRPNTQRSYQYPFKHLRTAAGEMAAADLRFEHLTGRYPHTHHTVRALKKLYAWALDEEFVPKNPFRKLSAPAFGTRRRILTRAEFARLLVSATPRYRRFLSILRRTMARPGELRLLRWQDVHLDAGGILLHEFKARNRRKDKAAVRRIPLDPVVRLFLRTWKARRKPATGDYVFPVAVATPDRPVSYNAMQCAFKRLRKRAGMVDFDEPIVMYTLRHTGATEAIRGGVSERVLCDVLGHTDTRTTGRYVHLQMQDLVEAVDRLHRRPRLRIAAVG